MSKKLSERLMNLLGHYWWPPESGDPGFKGPPPRLISREQYEAMMKMREEGTPCEVRHDK